MRKLIFWLARISGTANQTQLSAFDKMLTSDRWLVATKKGEEYTMDSTFAPNDGLTTASNGRAIYIS